jgi:F-type H+-transporting ATPase subunit epsilon
MNLAIVTPESTTTVANVDKVSLPGSLGRFMVLQGHAPLISTLTKGVVRYSCNGDEVKLSVSSGVVEVQRDEVSLIIEQ